MPNILDEYLIKLGFTTDTVGYARFANALRDASTLVDNQYLRMGKAVLGFQAAVTGMFATVGATALGFADRTAMADQEYRLLALHMYTSLPVARELKIALDALGQPLENIMWDPELARRFNQLVKDQRVLTQELGPGFENQMLKIRDVRFEFTRFGVELKYLTMLVVEDLAKAFGTSVDGMLEKMRHFNAWFIANIPYFANVIATKLKPVLIDVYNVLKSTFSLFVQIGGQLKQINWSAVIGDIAKAVIALTRLEQNLVLLFAAANDARKGNLSAAMKDLSRMQTLFGPSAAATPKGVNPLEGAGPGLATPANVKAAIVAQAKAFGVPPELALAVAQTESNFRQFDKSGKVLASNDPRSHATGIFQLQPGTARMLGVNPFDAGENITGGVKYLKQLLDSYGNVGVALQHYYGSRDASKNQDYASRVMQAESTIHIEVNVATDADPKQIASEVAKAVTQAQQQRTQRNIAEFQVPGWSY